MEEKLIRLGALVNATADHIVFFHTEKLFHLLTKTLTDVRLRHARHRSQKYLNLSKKVQSTSLLILAAILTATTVSTPGEQGVSTKAHPSRVVQRLVCHVYKMADSYSSKLNEVFRKLNKTLSPLAEPENDRDLVRYFVKAL